MKKYGLCLAALPFFMSGDINAAAIGMVPTVEQTKRVGYAFGGAQFTVVDPDGDAPQEWVLQPLSFIYTDALNGAFRYWSEAYYQEARLTATTTEIGQFVRRYGIRASLERQAELWGWRPWFGLGLDLSNNNYMRRHLIDDDGFLSQSFGDRSEVGLGMVLNAKTEWPLTPTWEAGAKLEQVFPFGSGVKTLSLSLVFLYTGNLSR